jgi:KaiC/GvpD/RAD55 family RecA-like ATPase
VARAVTAKKVDKAIKRSKAATGRRETDAASRKRAALLEVSLGRQCANSCAVAWLWLAVLALGFYWKARVINDAVGFFSLFAFLLPLGPALAGLAVGGTALMTKRGQLLRGHLLEPHNVATLLGITVSVLVLSIAIGVQFGSLVDTVGVYTAPLGVAGISFGLLGYLLTWGGWSYRKVLAVACAVVPAVISGFHIVRGTDQQLTIEYAALEYLLSGGLFMVAGVVFVVSMSSTSAAEREIVRGADERIAAEYARLKSLKKELDVAVAQTSDRAAELAEDTSAVEARRREADDYALQATRLKDEAAALFDRASHAEAAAATKIAQAEGRIAAIDTKEKELAAQMQRRKQEDGAVVELRQTAIQQKAEAEAVRRKIDAERQAVAEQMAHAKREREAARATLQAAEEKGRQSEAAKQQVAELRRQLDDQKQVIDARTSAVDTERVIALEAVQAKLAAERDSLEKERVGLAGERAKVAREAQVFAEREAALSLRAKEVETVEASLGDAFSKLAKEKAAAEALDRQAKSQLAELGDRSKATSESAAKIAEREAGARALGETVKAQEARVAQREAKVKELDAELARRTQQVASERKTIAAERERIQADAARLKEREEAIFHFEHQPEFAREAAKALSDDLEIGAPTRPSKGVVKEVERKPEPPAAAPAGGLEPGRLSFGNTRFNELTGGGLPSGSSLLVVGPAFCGKEAIPLGFIAAGLAQGEPAIVVTTVRSPAEVVEELGFYLTPAAKKNVSTLMRFVDCSTKAQRGDIPRDHVIDVASPADFPKIKESIAAHFKAVGVQGHEGFRFAYLPLTESWRLSEPSVARNFVQQMVAAVRRQGGGAIWVAESGIHGADEIESLAGMMQGVVRLQEERDGHALRVQGIPGVKPHQWIRYRHSPKGIDLGSFELERIR